MFSGGSGSRRIPRGREESEIGDWEECVRSGELGKCKEERKEGRKEGKCAESRIVVGVGPSHEEREVGAPAAVIPVAPLTCCMRAALSIMVAGWEPL